jgi:hypothetical protein
MTVACSGGEHLALLTQRVLTFLLAFDKLDRVKRARIDVTEGLDTETQDGYRSLQRGLASTSTHIEQTVGAFINEVWPCHSHPLQVLTCGGSRPPA